VQDKDPKDNFLDVVPPFIGDVPGHEFANEYGDLMVANSAKLRQELAIAKLSDLGKPGELKGKTANAASKARATMTRATHRKVAAETEAAEAAAKNAKVAQKKKKKGGSKQIDGEADEIAAQAAQEERNRRGPSTRPTSTTVRRQGSPSLSSPVRYLDKHPWSLRQTNTLDMTFFMVQSSRILSLHE
jgi:hypothetical protein